MGKSNCLELLSLKKVISQRLDSLTRHAVADNISVDIQFVTDSKKFESAVEDSFGHFKLRDDSVMRSQAPPPPLSFNREVERQTSLAATSQVPLSSHIPPSSALYQYYSSNIYCNTG